MISEEEKKRIAIFKQVSEIETKILNRTSGSTSDSLDIMEAIAAVTMFINPPVGIVLGLATVANKNVNKTDKTKQALSESKMPDSWLKEVAESDFLSDEGLKYLTSILNKKGYISVEEGIRYVAIENKIAQEEQKEKEKEKLLGNEGALSLLKKAETKFGGEYLNSTKNYLQGLSGNLFENTLATVSKTVETSNRALDLANIGLDMLSKKIKKDQ
jgi:hypothetical protein